MLSSEGGMFLSIVNIIFENDEFPPNGINFRTNLTPIFSPTIKI